MVYDRGQCLEFRIFIVVSSVFRTDADIFKLLGIWQHFGYLDTNYIKIY